MWRRASWRTSETRADQHVECKANLKPAANGDVAQNELAHV